MKGYTKMKLFGKAGELLKFMQNSKTAAPNTVTNNTYLQCCLETEHYAEADAFFAEMPNKDIITYSTFIKGLFKQERTEDVIAHFEAFISEKENKVDQVFFNIVVGGFIKRNKMDYVTSLTQKMMHKDFKLNEFNTCLFI